MGRAGIVLFVLGSCALPGTAEFSGGSKLDPSPDGGANGDGGLSSSGGIDAGAEAGDGGGLTLRGCAGHPSAIFCSDFDTDPYDNGFDTNNANGGVSSDANVAVSPPRSLVASLGGRGAGQPATYLEHFLDPAVISYRLSWSAKLEDGGTQTAVHYGVSVSRDTPVYHSLSVRYVHFAGTAPKLVLFEYANAQDQNPELVDFNDFPSLPKVGQFQRFEMRITQSASASSVTVLIDGAAAFTDHALTFHRSTGPTRVMAGIAGSDGAGDPVVVHVDDVAIDPP